MRCVPSTTTNMLKLLLTWLARGGSTRWTGAERRERRIAREGRRETRTFFTQTARRAPADREEAPDLFDRHRRRRDGAVAIVVASQLINQVGPFLKYWRSPIEPFSLCIDLAREHGTSRAAARSSSHSSPAADVDFSTRSI